MCIYFILCQMVLKILAIFLLEFKKKLCPDLYREGHYEMMGFVSISPSVCPSVCLSRASRMERPKKPKLGTMEACLTGNTVNLFRGQ